ncbi:MAG TPA: DUF1800 domain-containing protein [Bryobacteraceae bacterium]|nr:DUF1800 domain-containing protein [Bryobacteraceae bacterium]
MQKIRFGALLAMAAALPGGVLTAQTVTLAPTGYITAGPGGTVQFTATVSGYTGDMKIVWMAGGKAGGNSTVGTITQDGLFTAPTTVPSSGMTPVMAALGGNTKIAATGYVYLLNAGPTITAVTPDPLPPGTQNVTITGSGFLTGALIWENGVQLTTKVVNSTTLTASVYNASATASASFSVRNPSSVFGNTITVPVSGKSSGGDGSSGSGSTTTKPVVSPGTVTMILGATQQFSAPGATSWTAVSGTITSSGLYTAPSVMPGSGSDAVTAINSAGSSTATVSLLANVPPTVTAVSAAPLPLGVFSTTVTGTGFTAKSVAQLNGLNLTTTFVDPATLTVTGFAGPASPENLTVANGPLVSAPLSVPVGVQNPLVSPSAARRFLEQAAFGPTPADAARVQTIGFNAWLDEQLAMPEISSYASVSGSQGGLPNTFLANAVTNADQLRQRVAFALSQIFVVSLTKLIWNDDVAPYEQMLIDDAFTNYRRILGDATLTPAMADYLDMANNAKANTVTGTAPNENYAREVMQLFSLGDVLLNQDGTVQVDGTGAPIPTYLQSNVTELARVLTGWTYTQPNGSVVWGGYINSSLPMGQFPSMHDFGSKTLLNGYVAAANLTMQQDLDGALDNIATHPNAAPFISKQLIQHLVKSNPTPAYVQRVAQVFTQTNGDMPSILKAILLDSEARANDEGGSDLVADGHMQEPALFIPGFVRAFGGQMTTANYYSYVLAALGQDIYNPASVFNYYSPGYTVAGTGGLKGPEFQLYNPNASILRENVVAGFFSQYSNPVASNGPGTTADLSPFLPLAANPATLVSALDLTLTHGTMPAAMKQIVVDGVTQDSGGALHRVQTACYLILTSNYYNVWH